MTEQASDRESSSPARSLVGLVVANTSLIAAILIYMGWSYDNALYGAFHLNPLDLGLGPQEYALRSLSLFSPVIVVVAVLFIVVMSTRSWGLDDAGRALARAGRTMLSPTVTAAPSALGRNLAIGAGVSVTAVGLVLYWIATRVTVSTFLVLALLGGGPLLLTWPARARRPGRMPYALALVIAAVCALWAGSVYAQQEGAEAAQKIIRDLPTTSDVVIYSTQPLALSGQGIHAVPFTGDVPYRWEYSGLRLLLDQSGTFYLLPSQWVPGHDFTYIVDANDEMRIVLY
jgi:hypothetical protein